MEARALDEFNEELKMYLDTTCDKMGDKWDAELQFPDVIGNKYHDKCNILQFVGDIDKNIVLLMFLFVKKISSIRHWVKKI